MNLPSINFLKYYEAWGWNNLQRNNQFFGCTYLFLNLTNHTKHIIFLVYYRWTAKKEPGVWPSEFFRFKEPLFLQFTDGHKKSELRAFYLGKRPTNIYICNSYSWAFICFSNVVLLFKTLNFCIFTFLIWKSYSTPMITVLSSHHHHLSVLQVENWAVGSLPPGCSVSKVVCC